MALKNYADVQNALKTFVTQAGVTPGQAKHGAFWMTMSYGEFTTGNVPNVPAGPWRICVPGQADQSNIIQILCGYGDAFNSFGQMPQNSPPYVMQTYTQYDLICDLRDWINNNCPNPTS